MDETKNTPETEEVSEAPQAEAEAAPAVEEKPDPTAELQAKLSAEHDNFLRLAAEYDNFRKRTQKERESLYQDAKAGQVPAGVRQSPARHGAGDRRRGL